MRHVRFADSTGIVRTGIPEDDVIRVHGQTFAYDEVNLLAPSDPSKIIGVGGNHMGRYEETGEELPERPIRFMKPPCALAGHGDTVRLPVDDEEIIFEGEFGVVIGEHCRNVSRENAMDVVAGFTCVDDITKRTDTMHRAKAFDNSLVAGPYLVSLDDVPEDPVVETRINGEVKQRAPRSELVFDVPEIIEDITASCTLEPGDLIPTGTPTGAEPLNDGDTVEVEVEGVGTLEHDVTAI